MPPPPIERTDLGRPLLLLNLKAYSGVLGPGAERIARTLEELGREAGVHVAIAPSTPDLGRVAAAVSIPVIAQHVDPVDPGAHTGFIPPEAVAKSGGWGSLLNHSEHPLPWTAVANAVRRLDGLGLSAVVCARNVAATVRAAATGPAFVAIEPPELIGGDRAVSTAAPELVARAVAAVHRKAARLPVLCGAGIHDRRDVHRALELGSEGVLVASAVARAPDPREAIVELLAGF